MSRRRKITGLVLLILLLAGGGAAYAFRPTPIDPAPRLETLGASAERGAYLATAGNCRACHTTKNGDAYAGGVPFHTDFGTIYSTNITSSSQQGIGRWSFADFYNAMKHGLRPNGSNLYPAFPYTHFARLKDEDIGSLYLYFANVAPSFTVPPENRMDFPFGERRLMLFWNRMFHDPVPFAEDPAQSAEWNRGAYLVESIAHCGACHSPRNMLGGQNEASDLSGGIYVSHVFDSRHRTWAAVDLTPSADGLARWSAQDIADYLRNGFNDHTVVHGPMNEVVIDSTSKLSSEDTAAMASYLTSLEPDEAGFSWPFVGGDYDLGDTVYTVHCGTCHLPDGDGDPTLGVSLAGNAIVQAENPASLINVILYGPDLPPPPFSVSRTRMKPFGKRLSDEDIAAVATYVRNSFGNSASSVSEDEVTAQR